jgi:hypothetical protein
MPELSPNRHPQTDRQCRSLVHCTPLACVTRASKPRYRSWLIAKKTAKPVIKKVEPPTIIPRKAVPSLGIWGTVPSQDNRTHVDYGLLVPSGSEIAIRRKQSSNDCGDNVYSSAIFGAWGTLLVSVCWP